MSADLGDHTALALALSHSNLILLHPIKNYEGIALARFATV